MNGLPADWWQELQAAFSRSNALKKPPASFAWIALSRSASAGALNFSISAATGTFW